MPISTQEIIEVLKTFAQDERLKVTITESLKGGAIAGGAAVLGGLILGPPGIAVGGCLGACVGAATSKKFLSVVEILATMDEEKKEALAQNVRQIINNLDVADGVVLAGLMAGNTTVRQQVHAELINFFTNEMQMAIV